MSPVNSMRSSRGANRTPRKIQSTQASATSRPTHPAWTSADTQLLSSSWVFHHWPSTGMNLTDRPPPKATCQVVSAQPHAARQAIRRESKVLVPSPPRSTKLSTTPVVAATTTATALAQSSVTTSPTRGRRTYIVITAMPSSTMIREVREPVSQMMAKKPSRVRVPGQVA